MKRLIAMIAIGAVAVACTPTDEGSSPGFESPVVPGIESPALESPGLESPAMESPAMESPAGESPAAS